MNGFYDSKWQSGDVMRPVRNPFDEHQFEEAPDYGPEVLDRAIDGMARGSAALGSLSREDHHSIFVRLHTIMSERREELIKLIQIEQGKPFREADSEFGGALLSVESLANDASLIGPEIEPLAREPASRGGIGFTLRQPHGVVGILTPVVFPLLFPVIQTCYALAAGNSVLLKPARTTPITALKLVEMLLEAGLPPAAVACLPGPGHTLGKAICSDSRLNFLSCMGRIPTVTKVRNTVPFIPTQLQWGCVSSVIVDQSADIDRLLSLLRFASFDNAGQSAFTTSWIAAVDEVHDEIVDRLAAAMESLNLGSPLDPNTEMGPVTSALSKKAFDEVVARERSIGAEVVSGGTREGRRIRPTLLRNCVPGQSILARQEVSGPVVGICRISNPGEAIDLLRHQRYHVLSLFTDQEGEAVTRAIDLPFENIHVNGIPNWRDGLVCVPGQPPRSGLRSSHDRVRDFSRKRDVVCHSKETVS